MAHDPGERAIAEKLPESLTDDAVVLLFADNFRRRQVLRLLRQAADGTGMTASLMRAVNRFLGTDAMLHIRDEEESLFPALRLRCRPEDRLDRLIGHLAHDHDAERRAIAEIGHRMTSGAAAVAVPLSPDLRRLIAAFVDLTRNHIIDENALLLPLARLRLPRRELARLGQRMLARRRLVAAAGSAAARLRTLGVGSSRL
jgi:hemerythrin-like domain-containing protein